MARVRKWPFLFPPNPAIERMTPFTIEYRIQFNIQSTIICGKICMFPIGHCNNVQLQNLSSILRDDRPP